MVSTSTQAKKAFHLCWGDNSKERLTLAGVAERNLIITGAIQLDYGRPAFEAYFLDRGSIASEFELDCSKEWLLLISSFAYVNYGSDAIKELENQFGCSLVEQVKLHTASQSVVLDWTERLMKAVDYEIIYRPHPSEKVDDRLKKMQVHYPRFHVIPNYSVKQWAKVSDKTNLWISTSNAELSAMGIDYAIVRPVPIPAELEVESMREESFITDYDAFFQYNTSGADGFSISPSERMKKLSHYYSYDENVPSYVKVADCLEKIIKTDCGATYYFSFSQQIRFGWQELKKLVISFIMEKYQNKPYHTRVSRLPLKQIIRNNIIRNLDNHAQEKQTEAAMLQYMENEVPPQNSARNTYN
ncbi:hypothetical protein SDC9_121238 [bioreactor metagenome]|uniref:Uncharacterized protein n=1 Tax=bioreactor metagenome TaxID=1076179 RepID=A0A645CBE6_9ZZZZ